MILCIDSGNTRIKWAAHDGRDWIAQGIASQGEARELSGLLPALPAPEQVMVANVAGAVALAAIATALGPWRERIRLAQSREKAAGVSNGYANPGQLGVDRWCALVGARARVPGPCLVVGAGTATTIDSLDANGRFLGGFILPGIDLMRQALAGNTAGLPLAEGSYAPFPDCTADAIFSGCVEAAVGAAERAWRRLPGAEVCLLFGGAAPLLADQLAIPHRIEANLVLEGLLALAPDYS